MEIMGRGPRQILAESPCYFHILTKFAGYRLFNRKSPLYGSADIINVCNLHCEHCYWWLNREENEELDLDGWRRVIDEKFKKNHVFIITLVGGEPLMRRDVVDLFVKEFPKRVSIVTNGTFPIPHIPQIYFYWISIDGDQKVHDRIRGDGSWAKTRKNVLEYAGSSDTAYKDIWITMTINSQNHMTVKKVIDDWKQYSNKIGFQFHTPFMKGDPLWMPFGEERTRLVDELVRMSRQEHRGYIINPPSQLNLMKGSWGGNGTVPVDCPTWAILSVDHMGNEKRPCCIGSARPDSMKPRCEECGLGCYSVLVGYGMKG